MPTTSTAVVLDRAELAWAAGFFDGEGSTIARSLKSRPGYHQLNVTVPQSGRDGVPPVLLRFQRVMLGMGHINGPGNDGIYMLRYLAREEARLVLDLMWPQLGDIKRAQATRAIELVEQQYASGAYRRRAARRRRPEPPTVRDRTVSDLERAGLRVSSTPKAVSGWHGRALVGEVRTGTEFACRRVSTALSVHRPRCSSSFRAYSAGSGGSSATANLTISDGAQRA